MTRCDEKDLRKARESAGMTRLEASEKLGVSDGTLKRWEFGEVKPSPEDVSRMEAVYNTPGLWYRWMWSNHDSFRDHLPALPEIDQSLLSQAIGLRYEMEDVQKVQSAVERDRLDGRIDDQRTHAIYGKETDDLLAVLLAMKMMEKK